MQPNLKPDLREVRDAPDRATAEAAIALFAEKYALKDPKAVDGPVKDSEALIAFFDFPAEHCDHLRTTNPIESVLATLRHRTAHTKGALSHKTATLIVFNLFIAASKTWRRPKAENRLPMIVDGVTCRDGVENNPAPLERAFETARYPIPTIAP